MGDWYKGWCKDKDKDSYFAFNQISFFVQFTFILIPYFPTNYNTLSLVFRQNFVNFFKTWFHQIVFDLTKPFFFFSVALSKIKGPSFNILYLSLSWKKLSFVSFHWLCVSAQVIFSPTIPGPLHLNHMSKVCRRLTYIYKSFSFK